MINEPNYLAHYGITGMRWGIRRYQNEDGTLTPEGRERYHKGEGESIGDRIAKKVKSAGQKAVAVVRKKAADKKESFVARHKPVSSMSDEELRAHFNRLNMERSVKQIQNDLNGKNKQKKSFSQKHPIIQQVAVTTAVGVAAGLITNQLKVKADEILAPRRMERAKEKGMLNKDLFPFVYNNQGRITSYNLNQDAKNKVAADLAAKAKQEAKEAYVNKYHLSPRQGAAGRASVSWNPASGVVRNTTANRSRPTAGQTFMSKAAYEAKQQAARTNAANKVVWEGIMKKTAATAVRDIKPIYPNPFQDRFKYLRG